MKKIYVASLSLLVLFASCKKSNSTDNSVHFTCTVGGTAKTFNTGLIANKVVAYGVTTIDIHGISGATAGAEAFELQIDNALSGDSIIAGNYTDTNTHFETDAVYDPNTSALNSYEAGNGMAADAVNAGVTIKNHFTVHITAIDAGSIRGTFSGDMFYNADVSSTVKTVASGDFYAKLQ